MRTFQLRATSGKTRRIHTFHSVSDTEAIGDAAFRILSLAYPNQEPWATGRIELINDMGVVLREMGEKK